MCTMASTLLWFNNPAQRPHDHTAGHSACHTPPTPPDIPSQLGVASQACTKCYKQGFNFDLPSRLHIHMHMDVICSVKPAPLSTVQVLGASLIYTSFQRIILFLFLFNRSAQLVGYSAKAVGMAGQCLKRHNRRGRV